MKISCALDVLERIQFEQPVQSNEFIVSISAKIESVVLMSLKRQHNLFIDEIEANRVEYARLSASFLLKTIGDLNLRTLLCGPSVCRSILSSRSLEVTCVAS